MCSIVLFGRMIHCQDEQSPWLGHPKRFSMLCIFQFSWSIPWVVLWEIPTNISFFGLRHPMERKKISQSNEMISTRSTLHRVMLIDDRCCDQKSQKPSKKWHGTSLLNWRIVVLSVELVYRDRRAKGFVALFQFSGERASEKLMKDQSRR